MRSPAPKTLFLFLLPLLLACEKERMGDCFKGHGEMGSSERKLSGVRAIELHDHVRLHIHIGKEEKAIVKGGSKLIPQVSTRMKKDTLVIRDENRCNWVRSYKKELEVEVTVKELHALINRSTADITLEDTVQGERFQYDQWNGAGDVDLLLNVDSAVLNQHTGAADLYAEGSSEHGVLYCAGIGSMYLEALRIGSVWAHSDATGNMELYVENELDALIESIGSIFYKGPGKLKSVERSGNGRIEKKD